jgi:pimeloyl-ACP methyl ester carboxylesterase
MSRHSGTCSRGTLPRLNSTAPLHIPLHEASEIGIAALNHIDNSRLVLLSKCGHWPPYEHPQEYTGQVLNFLR